MLRGHSFQADLPNNRSHEVLPFRTHDAISSCSITNEIRLDVISAYRPMVRQVVEIYILIQRDIIGLKIFIWKRKTMVDSYDNGPPPSPTHPIAIHLFHASSSDIFDQVVANVRLVNVVCLPYISGVLSSLKLMP